MARANCRSPSKAVCSTHPTAAATSKGGHHAGRRVHQCYQQRLDAARDRIADGDITEADLEELDAELADLAPPAVRARVPGMDVAEDAPEFSASFTKSATIPQVPSAGMTTPAPSPIQ